ncbi:MAG: hypothetical protein EAZ47_00800 [Bacteroidetes bacterium]|nr:MAG: hypothetical protein EAZ47_00800 [Bacteroidota bacterium]
MKQLVFFVLLLLSSPCFSQGFDDNRNQYMRRIFDAKYMQKPPIFQPGKDSLQRFYFNHFQGFENIIQKCIEKGDTAKYIRVYFNFTVDENGIASDAAFFKVASTQYAQGEGAKTIKYFFDDKKQIQEQLRKMVSALPTWLPGIESGQRVSANVEDYLQFWVGLQAPPR